MVEKTGRGAAGRRRGRRSAAEWARWRDAYEDGATLDAIAAAAGLRLTTIAARAAAEDWLSPRRAVRALERALEAEIAGVEGALSAGSGLSDPDKRVRALEGLARAAERLAALRVALPRVSPAPVETPLEAGDGAHADAEGAELAALRAELERRLDRCAAALGAPAVPGGAEPGGAEGVGENPPP